MGYSQKAHTDTDTENCKKQKYSGTANGDIGVKEGEATKDELPGFKLVYPWETSDNKGMVLSFHHYESHAVQVVERDMLF